MNNRESVSSTGAEPETSDAEHRHHDRRTLTPQLSSARQWALWLTILLLVVTGAVWLWAEYVYQPGETGMEPYAIKHYAMLVHALFALVFVYAAGTLLYTHMQMAWRQQRNRASGAVMAVFAAVLVLSGYGLWYAGGETLRPLSEVAHWVTGFGLPPLLLLHALLGKRRVRAAATRRDPGVPVP